jgi:hypothetical protein
MLPQGIGWFQIRHMAVMRAAFALRKGVKTVWGPSFFGE